MSTWVFGAIANGVIFVAYLAIAYSIFSGIWQAGQWQQNPLAVATGLIFFTCGVGHGFHLAHLLGPSFGFDLVGGEAARIEFGEWHLWAWDGITAGVAVWYWTLRGRFPALVRGAALFEDMRERQRQALEIHDNVVQGLVKTKLALDLGRTEGGGKEVEETLEASRKIIRELLGEPGSEPELGPGELRREVPAS
jgi:signal transduction histidine kinase